MTDSQALSTLLTVESFLLAVVSLITSLNQPGRARIPSFPVAPLKLAYAAAASVFVLALGAVLAWCGMYVGDSLRPLREAAVAVIILLAVLLQPVFAVMIALGLRNRK